MNKEKTTDPTGNTPGISGDVTSVNIIIMLWD